MKSNSPVRTVKKLALALVAAAAFSASATTYYWIGGASGDWSNGSNWSLTEGGEAANAYPSDYSVDEATVATVATITLPASNANVSNLFVNANVSLTGGKIRAKTISGSGKLTMLDGTSFYASEGSTVSVDVEIPAGATVYADTSAQYAGFTFTAECALTGSGTIEFKGGGGHLTRFIGTQADFRARLLSCRIRKIATTRPFVPQVRLTRGCPGRWRTAALATPALSRKKVRTNSAR